MGEYLFFMTPSKLFRDNFKKSRKQAIKKGAKKICLAESKGDIVKAE